jgi:8-oxo-dGTP pyrophosphatase MutT (NUDIX family)
MKTNATMKILRALRARLETPERVDMLVDTIEGYRPNARKSAVLLALFEQENTLYVAFIRRASTLRAHSGEIAFPGGSVDAADSSPVMTALREAHEEIGLEPEQVEVLGVLSPVFTVVSNYLILPVVAYLPHGLGTLHLQPSEVAELILAPLHALADPTIAHTEQWSREGMTRTVYFYDHGPYRIWGATGRILSMLLALLQDYLSVNAL